jgi:hypothetical protein
VQGVGADGNPVSPAESQFPLSVAMDADMGAPMNAIFMGDLRHAIEITPESFRQRPWTDHMIEYGASLLARVL